MTRKEPSLWWRSRFEGPAAPSPAAQAAAAERFLGLEPRSRVLDLGCGSGEQTLELSRLGHRVLGLENNEPAFAEARRRGREERLNVHFMKGDPRQIPYRAEFDAVVSLSGAFGFLESERDDVKSLESAFKALKPGGQLLLDLLNKEWLMRHFEPNSWDQPRSGRAQVVLDRYSFNFESGRLDNHRTFVAPDGARTPSFVSQRVYTLTEIKSLLARAGFEHRHTWGTLEAGAYGMDSPRMIVHARRPSAPAPRPKRPDDELPAAIRIKGRRKGR